MAVHGKFIEIFESLLKDKSLSQKELAEKIGLRRPSISDWKKKGTYPYADVAVEMAGILGVSVEYLITGKDNEGFSQNERDLVIDFRSLSGDNKRNVRALIDSMLTAPAEGEKGKKKAAG
jgi:transcriptional regulator with XRE-family HTH domain